MAGRKHVPLAERFWEKVDVRGADECWPWLASTTWLGYGRFRIGPAGQGHIAAHRVAYELTRGAIPDDLQLDHLCHTGDESCSGGKNCPHRRCVNPAHMEPVTRAENLRRGRSPVGINAAKTHCDHGHEFSVENTYVSKAGHRICRACAAAYQRNRRRSLAWAS